MLNHLKRAFVRVSDAVSCFLREPGRAVAAAGLAFGGVFVALIITLFVSMFVPTQPLATTVAVCLAWLAGAILGLIAVIVAAQLGIDKFEVTLPNGVTISAEDVRDKTVAAIEKVTENLSGD